LPLGPLSSLSYFFFCSLSSSLLSIRFCSGSACLSKTHPTLSHSRTPSLPLSTVPPTHEHWQLVAPPDRKARNLETERAVAHCVGPRDRSCGGSGVEAGGAVARFATAVLYCCVPCGRVPRWPALARAAMRECRSRQAAKKAMTPRAQAVNQMANYTSCEQQHRMSKKALIPWVLSLVVISFPN
jgi:hypothetical protein